MSSSTENIIEGSNYVEAVPPPQMVPNLVIRRQFITSKIVYKLCTLIILWSYFIAATYYHLYYSNEIITNACSGYGLLIVLFTLINIFIIYYTVLKPYLYGKILKKPWSRITQFCYKKIRYCSIVFYVVVLLGIGTYLVIDTVDDRLRLVPLSGLALFLIGGYVFSANRSKIQWHTVIIGLYMQFIFGLLTIRWSAGRAFFDCAGDKVNTFLGYAVNGSAFVYGQYLVYEQGVFAFKALATIYFLGFFINILYYYGIMEKVVLFIGKFLQWTMRTSICESVNSSANIFLSMTEAPLLLKPYLCSLTDSEVHSMMVSGFATVSGTVLAAYISFGANPAHLITASVMSAPAALCYSKLLYPETEEITTTRETIRQIPMAYDSVMDAANKGANDAIQLVLGIISSLVAFISFIYFVNGVLSWLGLLIGFEDISVELLVGKVFIPISFVMGVPWGECEKVGQLIGIKTVVNEFAAFEKLKAFNLTAKSEIIATYSICGFANPGSVGITLSALGVLIPTKRSTITKLVFRAFCGGAIVCLMTACIAGLLITTTLQ